MHAFPICVFLVAGFEALIRLVCRLEAPKQEEVPIQMVNPQVATKKVTQCCNLAPL
jgi:hypothetical protein